MTVITLEVVHEHRDIIAGPSLEVAAAVSCASIRARDVAVIAHTIAGIGLTTALPASHFTPQPRASSLPAPESVSAVRGNPGDDP